VLVGLTAAILATLALVQLARSLASPGGSAEPSVVPVLAKGEPAPPIVGTTLDGATFDLASLRGRPVLVNFWDAGCEPCRAEFPLLLEELSRHAAQNLAVVGILFIQAPGPARDFVAEFNATWPTVEDPTGAIRGAYRVAARPQTYFIDRDGILRSIQVGQLTDIEFERQYQLISGPVTPSGSAEPSPTIEIPPPP
jgi:cytochrome c biogenesis protein CcmG, thiol:disulfide interchange protein DsbE